MSSISWPNGKVSSRWAYEDEYGTRGWTAWADDIGSGVYDSGFTAGAVTKASLALTGGEKCQSVSISVHVTNEHGAGSQTLDGYLYTSDPLNSYPEPETPPSGYIKSVSVSHTWSGNGSTTLTLTFSGLNISANTTLYFWFKGRNWYGHFLYLMSSGTNKTTVSASFKPPYTLSVSPSSVTAGSKVKITIGNGSGTSITARIKYGSTQLWSGSTSTGSVEVTVQNSWFTTAGVTGHSMNLTVTIDQLASASASFTAVKSYTLSVSPASVTAGSNVAITVGNGNGVSITATIKYGNTQLWSGTSTTGSFSAPVTNSWFTTAGVTGHSMTVTVTVSVDTSLSKTFTAVKSYTLSVSSTSVAIGNNIGITVGNGNGTSITATIKCGSTQVWSGTSTNGSFSATVQKSWFTTAGKSTSASMSLTVTVSVDTSLSKTFTATGNHTLTVSPTSAATGSNVSITIGNGSGVSITARIKYGSTQLWSGTATTGSFSVAVNKSWFTTAGVTTAKSMALTVTIDQNTTLSASLTVTAGSNMNPTVGTLSFSPVNSGRVATNFPNSYIAGYSKVKVSAAVTSGSNASISSVVLSFPGGTNVTMSYNSTSQKYEGTTAAVINGNTTFTVTAKDGRTLSGSKQGTLNGVVAYVKPSVSPTAANCYRCNSSGTKQDGGSYVSAKATATWYSSLSGNALTSFLFYVKEDRTAGYSDSRNLTSGQQSQALQMHVPGANDYVTLVFSIQDKVSDAVTTEFRLPAAPKNVYVRRSSTGTYVGVGMAPQRTSGKSDIELPSDGEVRVGGFLMQSLSHFNSSAANGSQFGKDFLAVNLDNLYDEKNTEARFYKALDDTGWANSPVSGAFLGTRKVFYWSHWWCIVMLLEYYPKPGRIWTNTYNHNVEGGWTGWKSLTPA